MSWNELFPKEIQPGPDDIAAYAGDLWTSAAEWFDQAYGVKPKLTYSGCGMKPGWNVKYQKCGQSFGTLYPLKDAFDVMIVIAYRLDPAMEAILPTLTAETAALYRQAGDYMKMGKWMMLRVDSGEKLADLQKIAAVKRMPREGTA